MTLTRRSFGLGLLGLGPLSSLQPTDERTYDAAGIAPTVVDGTAYIVGSDQGLQAVDTATGATEWHNDEIDISNPVTVVDGSCFAPQERGAIVQIDGETGETIRQLSATSSTHPPLVADGICYQQTDDQLVAVDYLNNDELWTNEQYANPSRLWRSSIPTMSNGQLVTLGSDGIGAFDPYTGEKLWEIEYNLTRTSRAPTISDGRVYVAASRDRLLCADLETGDVRWVYTAEDVEDIHYIVVVGDTVVISGRMTTAHTRRGVIEALETSGDDPQHRWTRRHGLNILGGSTSVDRTVIVGTNIDILAVDIDDGSYEEIHDEVYQYRSVLLAEGRLYVNIERGFAEPQVRSFALEDIPQAFGSGGYHATYGHHDGWAERAARSVAALDLTIPEEDATVGEDVTVEVTVHLESGIEADVTDEAALSIPGGGASVGEDGTITLEESGTVTLEAIYDDSTATRTLEVQDEEDVDTDADGMPGAGVLTVATSLGATAYLLERRRAQ